MIKKMIVNYRKKYCIKAPKMKITKKQHVYRQLKLVLNLKKY